MFCEGRDKSKGGCDLVKIKGPQRGVEREEMGTTRKHMENSGKKENQQGHISEVCVFHKDHL